MVPLLIMATSLVSKINTSVALLKGWVNSFLAFMGQVYLGFYTGERWTQEEGETLSVAVVVDCVDALKIGWRNQREWHCRLGERTTSMVALSIELAEALSDQFHV